MSDPRQLIDAIRARFGERSAVTDPADIEPWLNDWRGRWHGDSPAILQPQSTEEVAAIVALANEHGVPLVPQGGNTSMVGGATPPADGSALILSLRRMNRVRSIDRGAMRAIAEAGVVLQTLHDTLQPSLYLEIGVRRGRSLALARGPAIGVDPAPELAQALPESTRLFQVASDDFFRDVAAQAMTAPPDLAFIDGMHLFEYALRDFMHVERLATPTTLVVIDDIYPSHPAQAERNRRTRVWSGDIWKLASCLAELRPDLLLIPLDTAPTGLLLVAGLDPDNRVLWNRYNPIVRRFSAEQAPPASVLQRTGVLAADDPRVARVLAALRQGRDAGANRAGVAVALRAALAGDDRG